jgi:hypothetical protein
LLVAAVATSVLLPAGLALADGEDDTTFDGDGAAYLRGDDGWEDNTFTQGPPLVDHAPGGDLFVSTNVYSYSVERGQQQDDDTEVRVARLNDDGSVDTAWGEGDGIAAARHHARNGTRQLAMRGRDDGGVTVVTPREAFVDQFTPDYALYVVRFDASGVFQSRHRLNPLDGCRGQSARWARILANGDVITISEDCVSPAEPCENGDRRGIPCEQAIGTTRLQRYEFNGSSFDQVHPPTGLALRPDAKSEMRPLHVWLDEDDEHLSILARYYQPTSRGNDFLDNILMRLDSEDVLDETLNGSGVRRFNDDGIPGPVDDEAVAGMVRAPDGKYVIPISTQDEQRGFIENPSAIWRVTRLDANGLADTSFGGDGETELQDERFTCDVPDTLAGLDDGRIVLVRDEWTDGQCAEHAIAVQLTNAGGLNPAWDGDGVREFPFEDWQQFFFGSLSGGTSQDDNPLPFASGKIVLPFDMTDYGPPVRIDGPPANGVWWGALRLNRSAPTPTQTPTTAQPVQTASTSTAAPLPQRVVPSRTCRSRRSLRIRLRTGRRRSERSPIVSSTITVNGRRVRAVRRGATVNLRNLPRGRYSVVIRLRLADGGTVRDVRRYRTCTRKIERELAPLRTRAPRRKRG